MLSQSSYAKFFMYKLWTIEYLTDFQIKKFLLFFNLKQFRRVIVNKLFFIE